MENILKQKVINQLKLCYDPEIPLNIYDLGLIYDIKIDKKNVSIKMTLTSPNCPVAESLPQEVKEKIQGIKEVSNVDLELVWDPPFTQDMMSEEAKLVLGLL